METNEATSEVITGLWESGLEKTDTPKPFILPYCISIYRYDYNVAYDFLPSD